MTDLATDALLDQIAKLRAKAEGTNNPHEAELFAAKVAELLAKHNLDEAMLRSRDAEREQGPIGEHPFGLRVPDAWRERIMAGVAKLYYCKLLYTRRRSGQADARSWRFVGREHNAIVAKAMAEYLFATVKRMAREYSSERSLQSNFRKGAGDRLYNRMLELAAAQRATPAAGAGDGTALMVLTEDQALADYLANTPTGKSRSHKHGAGSHAGWEAGGRIGLNTQVTETRAERMLS